MFQTILFQTFNFHVLTKRLVSGKMHFEYSHCRVASWDWPILHWISHWMFPFWMFIDISILNTLYISIAGLLVGAGLSCRLLVKCWLWMLMPSSYSHAVPPARHILIINFTLSDIKVKLTMSIISHPSFISYFSACVIYCGNFISLLQLIEITLNIAMYHAKHCNALCHSLWLVQLGLIWLLLLLYVDCWLLNQPHGHLWSYKCHCHRHCFFLIS